MKIVVALNGEVSIESNGTDPKTVAELIRELQHPSKKKKAAPAPAPEPEVEEVSLSSAQLETWQWLVDNDSMMAGRSAADVAAALDINVPAAQHRLSMLVKNGMAHRVSRGLYRPGEG